MLSAVLWCGLGFVLSLGLDFLAKPKPSLKRAFSCYLIHGGVWCLGFALELLLFQRPIFGIANLVGLQLLLIIISNMKLRYLREPFFYIDTEYFLDAIKHPRLYIPFFGIGNTILGFSVYVISLVLALWLESGLSMWGWLVLCFAFLAAGLLWLAGRLPAPQLSFQPSKDLQQLGFIPAMWHYARAEKQTISALALSAPFAQPWQAPEQLPDLVMVQSESFFDPRRLYTDWVHQDVLTQFDALAAQGQSGVLQVPSWGANTVRTEYAVLSGVAPSALGVHQFNPYRRLTRHQVPSLANYLRSIGYRTICVHPYAASFYRRNVAIPLLGFDEFIDIQSFTDADKFGAYVSDAALGQKIEALLTQWHQEQPVFIYVITMENHGPLHWETVTAAEQEKLLLQLLPADCQDLAAYVRHIQHADQMIGAVAQALANSTRPAGLCMFGDHVPIMSTVYKQLGTPDKATDYLLWSNSLCAPTQPTVTPLTAEQLSPTFLRHLGFRLME